LDAKLLFVQLNLVVWVSAEGEREKGIRATSGIAHRGQQAGVGRGGLNKRENKAAEAGQRTSCLVPRFE